MIRIRLDALADLVPTAQRVYLVGLPNLPAVMACFGILTNANRAAHFLAQILHESAALTVLEENLRYTTAARIRAVWPKRFPTVESALPYLRNPEGLAEKVYGGRMGNTRSGDGWLFRGRGPIQSTGHDNYAILARLLDVDFVAQPDLVVSEQYVWPVAAAMWRADGCNALADRDDVRAVSRAIVGDTRTVAERATWLVKTWAVVEDV